MPSFGFVEKIGVCVRALQSTRRATQAGGNIVRCDQRHQFISGLFIFPSTLLSLLCIHNATKQKAKSMA